MGHLIRRNRSLFQCAAEAAGFCFLKALTVIQAIDLRSVLNLSMSRFCMLRISFSNFGLKHLFPSELKMRKVENSRLQHLTDAEIVVENVDLSTGGDVRKQVAVPMLQAKNILGYITLVFQNLQTKYSDFFEGNPERKIHIVFGGDKGGQLMKFHFEIVSKIVPATAHNVHVFGMYDGYDGAENIFKALSPFR